MPYNGKDARICAELSQVAYQRRSEIARRIAAVIGANAVFYLSTSFAGNSRVLFVADDDSVWIVYRGTVPTSIRSWIANLKALKRNLGNGAVHTGFLTLYDRSAAFIYRQLRNNNASGKRIFFTGHSQGGAVAYLAAMTFALRHGLPAPDSVFTYGQPRAGDQPFTRDAERRLGRDLSRIANGRDIVIGVPFVFMGYDHSSEFLHYDQKRRIARRSQSPGTGWPFWNATVRDHDMSTYLYCSHVNENAPWV